MHFSNICKFLAGSFSAVSKRNFARKYAFDSIFQDLQDLHPFAPLQSQNFRKKSVWKNSNFREISAKKLQMSQNLQNFVKFQKFQLENQVDFEKCCRTHIYLQKSEPIQPKTSNVLPKFCQPTLSARRPGPAPGTDPKAPSPRGTRRAAHAPAAPAALAYVSVSNFWLAKFCKFLAGSFSAVSKRNFARKYAFDSSFQALQELHPFSRQSQNFRKKSVWKISNFCENAATCCKCRKFCKS